MAEQQVFRNPASGQEIRVLAADTAAVVVESVMPAESPRPPRHYHPSQHELFEVLEGEVATRIGDEERTYRSGERFEVPPGVVHEMWNATESTTRLRWETRPALNTLGLFETLGRVWQGDAGAGAELPRFRDEIRFDVP